LWTIKWVSCLITEVAFKRLELAVVLFWVSSQLS
jgi:hypothetical protein